MTFGEWYAPHVHPGMTLDEESGRERCREAWGAAVDAERGRCAKVLDDLGHKRLADRIREGGV